MNPEYKLRQQVSFSPESRALMAARRQEPHPLDKHYVPETEEQLDRAGRLTEKLGILLQDEDFFSVNGSILGLADTFLSEGDITDEQYISLNDLYRQTMQAAIQKYNVKLPEGYSNK